MAVIDIPTPRSYPQILGEMLDAVTGRIGIKKLKPGNPILSLLEAAARSDYRNTNDTFNILKSIDLDNSEGIALDRIGAKEQVPRLRISKATGYVTIKDSSFERVYSSVFQGTPAPIIGSASINVPDASVDSGWPATGSVYIGRGTNNVEGPLDYTSKVDNGSYWTLTLSNPTSRFHNNGEDVVLAQGGNRLIGSGTTLATPQGSLSSSVNFTTLRDASIPDGEVDVVNIPVVAELAGAQGNIPVSTLNTFVSTPPFSGATVTNEKPYVTGRDTEKDKDYRDRIRKIRNSRQKGTDLAIEQAMLGVVSPDQSRRVTSASLVRYKGRPDVLYVDDGSGLEERSDGVGSEVVVDSAIGGETLFEVINKPIAIVYLESGNQGPFALTNGSVLSVRVGGVLYNHTFDSESFNSIEAASAYEVVSSINSNPNIGFSARTTETGTKFAVFSRKEENDDLLLGSPDGIDANSAFLIPSSHAYTTMLYRDDVLLSKDGLPARLYTNNFEIWNSFSGVQTLDISVDNTPVATYAFTDQDFVNYNTGFTSLGKNTATAWAKVFNSRIPGITATVENDTILIVSNRGNSAKAGIEIFDSTLVGNLMWNIESADGADQDYISDRGTGQISLTKPLSAGERLTLGSRHTRGFIESPSIAKTNLSTDVNLWFAVDSSPSVITQGIGSSTELTASVERVVDCGFHVGIESGSLNDAFENVRTGDWLVFFDTDTDLPDALRNAWRVIETDVNKIVIEKTTANVPRGRFTTTALDSLTANAGKILVTGGYSLDYGADVFNLGARTGGGINGTCEILDPNTGAWSYAAEMITPRTSHTATKLPDGKVLVTGGIDNLGDVLDTAEIYDPVLNTWTSAGVMSTPRAWHSAVLMSSGDVLVAGGWDGSAAVSDSEEYDVSGGTFGVIRAIGSAHFGHATVVCDAISALPNHVLILGGYSAFSTKSAEVHNYDPVGQVWAAAIPDMARPRANFGAAIVSGSVDNYNQIIVMGDGEDGSSDSWTSYDVLTLTGPTWAGESLIPYSVSWRDKPLEKMSDTETLALYGTDGTAIVHLSIGWSAGVVFTVLPDSKYSGGIEKIDVGIVKTDNAVKVVAVNGINRGNFLLYNPGNTTAHHEIYNDTSGVWEHPDPVDALSADTLDNKGVAVLRTLRYLQKATIPAANNYTAPTFADAINDDLFGAKALVYRTNKIRVRTNTFSESGDITLLGQDGVAIDLPRGTVENVVGHLGSVESKNSGIGTPADFQVFHNLFSQPSDIVDALRVINVSDPSGPFVSPPPSSGSVVALRRWDDGINPFVWESGFIPGAPDPADEFRVGEYGNSKGFFSRIASRSLPESNNVSVFDRAVIGLRRDPFNSLAPHQPLYIGSHYSLSPRDTLSVVVDDDRLLSNFSIPMSRQVTPTSTTYGSQNSLQDFFTSDTLAKVFGLSYDFDDFAVFMQARTKTHSSDSTKRAIWRFYRHGAEGNSVALRYTYPAAADSEVDVDVFTNQNAAATEVGIMTNTGDVKANVHIVLGSGAARTGGTFRPTTKVGLSRTNGSPGYNVYDTYIFTGFEVVEHQRIAANGATGNRILVNLPNNPGTGVLDSGIIIGDTLWFEAVVSDPAKLFSGAFVVTAVDAPAGGQQNIYFDVAELGDGANSGPNPNPGTVSNDSAGESYFDPGMAVGDYVRLTALTGSPIAPFMDTTMRVVGFGRQYIQAKSLDYAEYGALTTPAWKTLGVTSRFSHFEGSTQTAQEVVDAVNALADIADSTVPVKGTITGDGLGIINRATWDEKVEANYYYQLTDGLNYVQRTIDPLVVSQNTEFLFRDPITPSLVSDSDWINEDVRLVPVHTSSVVGWLNTLGVTGLSSVAEVVESSEGKKVQVSSLTIGSNGTIEVQGGSSSLATASVVGTSKFIDRPVLQPDTCVVTVSSSEAEGLVGGHWVVINNTNKLPKENFVVPIFSTINSITPDGTWTFDTAPYTVIESLSEARVQIEKVGDFVAIHLPYAINNENFVADVSEQELIYLTALQPGTKHTLLEDISTANTGTFRVVRFTKTHFGSTVWIENSSAVEQVCVCKIKTLDSDTPVTNDEWDVSTTTFGVNNKKKWIIESVGYNNGEQYNGPLTIKVVGSPQALTVPTPYSIPDTDQLQLRQGSPNRLFKKILTVTPNQTDGVYSDIQLDSSIGYGQISSSSGSIISALDKLSFPTGVFEGVDGYRYNTGLIGECNRTLYGDKADQATYPGYAASGAELLLSGPLVKRVFVALSLRVLSGLATRDLADRVRSVVASKINQAGIGQAISISDIVSVASLVPGIVSVSVVKPIFNSSNDLIPVHSYEKALVQDLGRDIEITFVGE